MAITNFNTSNQTFNKLMGNGLVYKVPMFQRDYSWEQEHWDDLWQDIVALTSPGGEQGHYMGYLVLQSSDEKHYDIIDGQQRMTTLSLIILAVLKNLRRLVDMGIEPDDNKRREEKFRETYIGFLDPVTLITRSKLTLNRNNDQYYQSYLVPLETLPKRNLKASEHLLRKAFEWFDRRIRERFDSSKSGKEHAQFVDAMSVRLFFTVISVTDELNAFKVFETLNSRGVRLSSTDLLKNHLFSIVHRNGGNSTEFSTLEDWWEQIVGKLGSESVPDFLRIHWNSRNPITRQTELFKAIREHVLNKEHVFALVRSLDKDADLYAALGDPNDSIWNSEQSKYIGEMARFNVRQQYSLLLAARRILDDKGFVRVLRACSIIAFRYNIIGNLAPNEQERLYNSISLRMTKGDLESPSDIIRALEPVYPNDSQFSASFADKQFKTTSSRNKQIVKYILSEIEQQITGNSYDMSDDKYSIEHILPEHSDEEWASFSDEQIEQFIYRIGNLTILDTSVNRRLRNQFSEKRVVYKDSSFSITREIATQHDWSPEKIKARQLRLAKIATSIWKISELS